MKIRIALIVISAFALVSCTNKESVKEDMNVLFIVSDDLNTSLGCYGHPVVKSPNIDRLANMGVRFNKAYCNFAVCGPSRSSFLTGLRPETTTILDNKKKLESVLGDRITLPGLFRQNGYHTVSIGKVFHGANEHNDVDAWDEIYKHLVTTKGKQGEGRNMSNGALKWCTWLAAEGDDDDQQDGQVAKEAIRIIKQKREKPFFLAVGFHKPHDPFHAPQKYFDLSPLEACTPPEIPEGWEPPYEFTLPGQTDIFNKFTDKDKREFLRSYYACVSYMDAQLGKVLDALEETNQLDNTLIVFFGDHGYHLGEHNWWNKVTIFEKGTNAPFIVAGNSVKQKGAVSDAMFEFIDIYPTLADIMQLKNTPDYLDGKSFKSILENSNQEFRTHVNAVVRRGDFLGKMVKTKDWRYVEWDKGTKGYELYNQHTDKIEYNDVSNDSDNDKIIKELKGLLYYADHEK